MILQTELAELIQLLEAEIPANPMAPRNEKVGRELERLMARYFNALALAMPENQLEQIYYRYVKEG